MYVCVFLHVAVQTLGAHTKRFALILRLNPPRMINRAANTPPW